MKLYFIGEGRTDIGDSAVPAATGAVAVLVRRILREVAGIEGLDFQKQIKRLSHLRGKRSLRDKVFQAIKDARTLGYDGVVIVVDRDHVRNKDRLRSLKEPLRPFSVSTTVELGGGARS